MPNRPNKNKSTTKKSVAKRGFKSKQGKRILIFDLSALGKIAVKSHLTLPKEKINLP